MSYNIDRWMTKEMRDLRIPIRALAADDELDAPHLNLATNTLTFTGLAEGFDLRGRQDGEVLIVEHLEYWGEGSGSRWENLESILSSSTGYLHAVLVWEGGDTIERLIVSNGDVTQTTIELE